MFEFPKEIETEYIILRLAISCQMGKKKEKNTKLFETGNPLEIFNNENSTLYNSNLILSDSINNITILKSIFFNLFECINNFEYFKNSIIPLAVLSPE